MERTAVVAMLATTAMLLAVARPDGSGQGGGAAKTGVGAARAAQPPPSSARVTPAAVGSVQTTPARAPSAPAAQPLVEVHKDPTCGCCSLWVQHLRRNGFAATASNNADMTAFKDQHRVPAQARSCHTGLVGGYVLEGHVPASDIHRLLNEKPDILGLAVAGMPVGPPGMEGPGGHPFEVLALHKDGRTSVYSTQRP